MRYMVERNYVQVIGSIWYPSGTCAMEYPLNASDVKTLEAMADVRHMEELSDESRVYPDENITREDVKKWLATHSGDFQMVEDFCASIGDTEIEWSDLESALIYNNCMFPLEDE